MKGLFETFDENLSRESIVLHNVKEGDIWQLGKHRLMCGDSTIDKNLELLMNNNIANMLFTDPPYGIEYKSNGRTATKKFNVLKNDNKILDFSDNIEKHVDGWFFIWTSWKIQNKWIEKFNRFGYPTNIIIWDKGGGGLGDLKKTFSSDYESALVWNRGHELTGKRLGSVWKVKKDPPSSYIHPTQKPIKLSMMACLTTTKPGDIVLDLFGGSGSTLIGCDNCDRINYTMELSPYFCGLIIDRWESMGFNNKAKLLTNIYDSEV